MNEMVTFVRKTVFGIDAKTAAERADDIDRVLPFLMNGVDLARTERLAQFTRELRALRDMSVFELDDLED